MAVQFTMLDDDFRFQPVGELDMTSPPPRFLYFDLGNVLLFFDHRRAARQLASLAGCGEEQVYELVFQADLNWRCDAGEVNGGEFCHWFREQFATSAGDAEIRRAASDIFTPNAPMLALLERLRQRGHRLGLLSNTCDMHFEFFADGRYPPIPAIFEQVLLSFELRQMKPQPAIYDSALTRAGVEPHEIFFVDDLPANVAGARAAGWDALPYQAPEQVAAALAERGIEL